MRYQEHSVENLCVSSPLVLHRLTSTGRRYFIRWLDEYTAAYKAHAASPNAKSTNPQLALSFSRAKTTFFSAKSSLAINVESKNARFPQNLPHPPPSTFDGARREIEALLRESLTLFITTRAQGNAGFFHLLSVCTFGILCTLTGLVPILLQIYRGEDAGVRSIRLACIAPFWIGMVAFLGALHRVCPIVWMFGEGRQLQGYELARPSISLPVSHTTMMPSQTQGDLDSIDLSKLELGFPMGVGTPPDTATSGGFSEKRPMLPLTPVSPAVTRDRDSKAVSLAVDLPPRDSSPSPSAQTNTTMTAKPPGTGSPSQAELRLSRHSENLNLPEEFLPLPMVASPSALTAPHEITSAPMQGVSSSISPFAKYDPSSNATYTSPFDSTGPAPYLDFPQLSAGGPRLAPRRRPCPRTLGTMIVESTPKGARKWLNKIAGYPDEDEFGPGSMYSRPGPFAPMTQIESGVIKRSNYLVIIKSLFIATSLTIGLTVGLYFVPVKHH